MNREETAGKILRLEFGNAMRRKKRLKIHDLPLDLAERQLPITKGQQERKVFFGLTTI